MVDLKTAMAAAQAGRMKRDGAKAAEKRNAGRALTWASNRLTR